MALAMVVGCAGAPLDVSIPDECAAAGLNCPQLAPSCTGVYDAKKCYTATGAWDPRFSWCNFGEVTECALYGLVEAPGMAPYSSLCVAVCP